MANNNKNYPLKIGIVGGGQLGKMLSFAAKKMGFIVYVSDPTKESPAGQVSDRQLIGGYKDEKTTRKLASISDILIIEAEFVNDRVLQKIADGGKPVHPAPETIAIIKDKLRQKKFLWENKILTADYEEVVNAKDVERAVKKFGIPLMLKAREDAYDGKGNFLINKREDIERGLEKLAGRSLYVEKFVPFKKELAIMIARSSGGEIKTYPVVETIHINNVCDTVIAPARISGKARKNAESIAKRTVSKLKGAGLYGIEMFLVKNDEVLINEIAPRVHNSGHYTIEACITPQFEQHIRAVTGMPLGDTSMVTKGAVMKNILGTRLGSGFPEGIEKALQIPGVSIHIYGKNESRPGRKMGHITVVGESIDICLTKANKARKCLVI